MHSTQYLYGIDPAELENKFYFEALEYKRQSGIKLYRLLFLNHDRTDEEDKRMFYVEKALRHTEKLIGERNE